ncbi:MAG: hypothetical protein H8Z69_02430 [Nanohaloarchaea archaeon]|nr:hypothetical protein [Candidatus Nanohaloarchaea archaeon]
MEQSRNKIILAILVFLSATLLSSTLIDTQKDKPNYISDWAYKIGIENYTWSAEAHIDKTELDSGIYLVTKHRKGEVTSKQLDNAWRLYNNTYSAIVSKGWTKFTKAKQDGFINWRNSIHYVNKDFILDNKTLDPERPESLIYFNQSGEMKLGGAMYLENDINKTGKQVGGPLTAWHFHRYEENRCLADGKYFISRECDSSDPIISPEMLHVWMIKHPESQFSTSMWIKNISRSDYDKIDKLKFKRKELRNN